MKINVVISVEIEARDARDVFSASQTITDAVRIIQAWKPQGTRVAPVIRINYNKEEDDEN